MTRDLLRVALIAAAAATACTAAPEPADAPGPAPDRRAFAQAAMVSVPRLVVTADAQGGRRVELDLLIDNDAPGVIDSLAISRSVVAADRSQLRLLVGDAVMAPAEPPAAPGWLPPIIDVPPDARAWRRGRLAFDLPADARGPMVLRVPLTQDVALVPLDGAFVGPDGTSMAGVAPRGVDGRQRPAAVQAEVDGAWVDATPCDDAGLWLVPVAATAVRATATGFEPWEGPLDPDGLTTPTLRPTSDPWLDAVAWTTGGAASAPTDLHDLITLAEDPRALAAWVGDHIGVLPTTGLQQAPVATLRRGAGGPIDRAELARTALVYAGRRTTMVCGDLTPDQASALYARQPLPPQDGPFGDLAAQAATISAAWAPTIEASLADVQRPRGQRDRVRLVPEWCWIRLLDVEPPYDLDLRPASLRSEPLPFAWRAAPSITLDLWRVDVEVSAVVKRPGPAWETLPIATQELDAATLSQRAFVVDVHPDPDGRGRVMTTIVTDRGAAGQVVGTLPDAPLEKLLVAITLRDPLGVTTLRRELPIWDQPNEDPVPLAIRAMVSGDDGTTMASTLLAATQDVLADRFAPRGLQMARLDHSLYAYLRRHAAAGAVPAEPSVFVSTWLAMADGTVTRRLEEAWPPGPAVSGDAPDDAGRQALAGAQRAAVELLRSLSVPDATPRAPEVQWLADKDAFGDLGFATAQTQMRARRHRFDLDAPVGSDREGVAWVVDPVTAGTGPLGSPWPVGVRATPQPGSADALWATWEPVLRCDGLTRLRAALGAGDASPCGSVP